MPDLESAIATTKRSRTRNPLRKKPRSHQNEAVLSVVMEFDKADRATIVSACGTGKSVMGAEVFGELEDDSRYTIVFAPTLALISQTIQTWREQYPARMTNCLCVCSDPTVVEDDWDGDAATDLTALGCPVTTSVEETRAVFEAAGDALVVFCTYSSAPVVATAIPDDFEFQLGVFDEAHRTAGDPDRRFALALTDAEIPIAKRLFMTATARLVRSTQIGDEYVFSMDNERIYGRVVYRLTLGEAIRRGLVCDYKILVGCVKAGARIPVDWLDLFPNDEPAATTTSGQIAALLALYNAFDDNKVTRAITFHDRVDSAMAFRDLANQLPAPTGVPRITAHHVNGKMKVRERDAALAAFRNSKRAIATNVRCLVEGVDLPEVDMVALMSRRSSPQDVAQACGRTLRLSPETGKTHGYIFVPIYLAEDHESGVDGALAGADFTAVLDAIYAMASHDETLHEAIIRRATDPSGANDALWRKLTLHAPPVMVERLRSAITIRVMGAQWEDSWMLSYQTLARYYEQTGGLKVPVDLRSPTGVKMRGWLNTNRSLFRSKDHARAHPTRLALLNKIGALADHPDSWMLSYDTLARFHEESGGLKVPADLRSPAGVNMRDWLASNRNLCKDADYARAHPERLELLNKIGALDGAPADAWTACYETLAKFHAAHGHVRVPADLLAPTGSNIRFWRQTQKQKFQSPEHCQQYPERLALLNKIGAIDGVRPPESPFNAFIKWKESGAPQPTPRAVREWISRVRNMKRSGTLSAEDERTLIDAGFDFLDDTQRRLVNFIAALRQFRHECEQRGLSTRAFTTKHPDGQRMALAAQSIMARWAAGDYTPEQVKELRSLGLSLPTSPEDRWNQNFKGLQTALKENKGSFSFPKNSEASIFASRCRYERNTGRLSEERIALLDSIGFPWSTARTRKPGDMIERFVQFRAQSGRGFVDASCVDKELLAWAQQVRRARLADMLSEDLQRRLEAVGFLFDKPAKSRNSASAEHRKTPPVVAAAPKPRVRAARSQYEKRTRRTAHA